MTKVELSLRAKGLKNTSGFRNVSDPFVIVTLLAPEGSGKQPRVLGRTEVVDNNLNPDWCKTFIFDYELGHMQHFVVTVYDEMKRGEEDLNKQKKMGEVQFEIGGILGSPGNVRAKCTKSGGMVYAQIASVTEGAGTLVLSLRGLGLKNVERTLFGKSDPFFEVSALRESQNGSAWDVVYRSEYIDHNLNPVWKDARVSVDTLCRGDHAQPVKIAIFDYSKSGKYLSMGEFETSVEGLLEAKASNSNFALKVGEIVIVNALIFGKFDPDEARKAAEKAEAKKAEAKKAEDQLASNISNLTIATPMMQGVAQTTTASVPNIFIARAPPGKLGVLFANHNSGGTVVTEVRPESPLVNLVFPGNSILEIDGADVSGSTVAEISTIMALKRDQTRVLKVARVKVTEDNGSVAGRVSVVIPQNFHLSAASPGVPASPPSVRPVSGNAPLPPSLPVATVLRVDPPTPAAGRAGRPNDPTFVDYLSGGCQLNLSVAIDFTGSNGDPRIPGTLHHISEDEPNEYEKALGAIVGILANYDYDQKFAVMGFGAKYDGMIRHCFQCGPNKEAHGIGGVIDAYERVFKTKLTMSGPTVFAEVIYTSAELATHAQACAKARGEQAYSILLIVTDGAVTDLEATKRSIASVSNAPLSIIIVGVGDANFSAMQEIDDMDLGRDIVQFVPMNEFSSSREALTAATLDEVPTQLIQYFMSNGILPMKSVDLNEKNIRMDSYRKDEEVNLEFGLDGEGGVVLDNGTGYYDDSFQKFQQPKNKTISSPRARSTTEARSRPTPVIAAPRRTPYVPQDSRRVPERRR